MEPFNPYVIDDFTKDIINVYLKHDMGDYRLYNLPFFEMHYTEETVIMTLNEFADKCMSESFAAGYMSKEDYENWRKEMRLLEE